MANKLADRCEVRTSIFYWSQKAGHARSRDIWNKKKSAKLINSFTTRLLDTSLKGIIDGLNLRRPIYYKTASYGHFGREIFPWEKVMIK